MASIGGMTPVFNGGSGTTMGGVPTLNEFLKTKDVQNPVHVRQAIGDWYRMTASNLMMSDPAKAKFINDALDRNMIPGFGQFQGMGMNIDTGQWQFLDKANPRKGWGQ